MDLYTEIHVQYLLSELSGSKDWYNQVNVHFKDRDGRWGVIWGSHNKKVILQLLFKLHEYTFEDFKLNMKPF